MEILWRKFLYLRYHSVLQIEPVQTNVTSLQQVRVPQSFLANLFVQCSNIPTLKQFCVEMFEITQINKI